MYLGKWYRSIISDGGVLPSPSFDNDYESDDYVHTSDLYMILYGSSLMVKSNLLAFISSSACEIFNTRAFIIKIGKY